MPDQPPSRHEVTARLLDDLTEAARSARHSGDATLAADLDGRVEVLLWTQSRDAESSGTVRGNPSPAV